jgi:hypothetical protein
MARATGRGAALLAAALGCSSSLPERSIEPDCAAAERYQLQTYQPLEGATASWFNFGDDTPGATDAFEMRELEPPRCDSAWALVLTAEGHDDWGAGFGEYQTAMAPIDASEFHGVAFWARATGPSRSFTLTLQDRYTHPDGMVCTEPATEDVVDGAYTYNEVGMLVPVGGELASPEDCGNGYVAVVSAPRAWTLIRIPFESFRQEALPNLRPEGLDTSALYQFSINVPKDSDLELWIDDLGIYRNPTDTPQTSDEVSE